jgi:two-component system, OmpR family, KDP operon response regulator KdpE
MAESGPGDPSETALRILAVDDDPVNLSLIRAIVGRAADPVIHDALLREARSLGEARAVLGSEPIDILLLDVHLPDGLGLDLAAEVRGEPPSGGGPDGHAPAIVALTASVLPADQQAALDAGCNAFLAKPYAASALTAVISRLAAERRAG